MTQEGVAAIRLDCDSIPVDWSRVSGHANPRPWLRRLRPTRAGPLRQSTRAPKARTIGTHLSDSAFMKRAVSARE